MSQYRCKYFTIKELVNPDLLSKIGEKVAWRLLNPTLLKKVDALRDKFGPITINTPTLKDCGLRDPLSTTGAKYSQHKLGNALDLHIVSIEKSASSIKDPAERKKFKAKEYNNIRQRIMLDPQFDCLSFEYKSKDCPDGITWLHIECSNREDRLFNA